MSNDEELLKDWLTFNPRRLVSLGYVGGGDYCAAILRDPNYVETFALLSTAALNANMPFPAPEVPFHEGLGRLPYHYQRRVEVVTSGLPHRDGIPYCGRPTGSGRPCRNQVRSLGSGCYLHYRQPLSDG